MRRVIAQHEVPSQEEMLGWIHALCTENARLAGTPQGRKAEESVKALFREIGLEGVAGEEVPVQTWKPDACSLECQGTSFPAYPLPRSRFTGKEGVKGPMVFVGVGEPQALEGRNLEGRIVVADVPFSPRPYQELRRAAHAVHDPGGTLANEPETRAAWLVPSFARAYAWCAARGAASFVGILKDLRGNRYHYHYPYTHAQEILSVPGVFVGRDEGMKLKRLLTGGMAEGRLMTSGRTSGGASNNILGYLPGVSDALILVTSHHDSPSGGFVDDASGMALVLAIAKHFARKSAGERPLSLAFLAATGNYLSNVGARDFLARHAHDLVPRIVLTVTLEHVAREVEERNGELVPTGQVEPRGVFVSDRPELLDLTTLSILGNDLRRSFIVPVLPGQPVDGEAKPYFEASLPSIGFISGPEYVLTEDDRPQWVAEEELVPAAKTFIEILEAFMRLGE